MMIIQDAEHNLIKFLRILCPMHLDTTTLQILGKNIKIICQMGNRMHLNFRSQFAKIFPFRKFMRHLISLLSYRPEGSIMPGGLFYICRKLSGSLGMFCTHSPAAKICTT